MQPDHWRAACKLIYMLPFAVVFSWACSSGDNGGSRLVLPKDVNEEELLAAIPADALPNNFEELSPDLDPEAGYPPPSLEKWYGDGDGNIVVFVIVVEAADARLERHIQSGGYEITPLSAVTGLQSTFRPGEECDQSADITSPTACAWRPLPNPKVGEDSAAYETAIPSSGRTGRVFLFVNSGVFASLSLSIISSEPSPLSEDIQTELLEALNKSVKTLVENKSVPD